MISFRYGKLMAVLSSSFSITSCCRALYRNDFSFGIVVAASQNFISSTRSWSRVHRGSFNSSSNSHNFSFVGCASCPPSSTTLESALYSSFCSSARSLRFSFRLSSSTFSSVSL
uniref:Putative secreted protein n=1 Tax=Anopheles marajoara TaxID=58244 RepID=A0A2M4C7R7_9DIPT